MDKNLITPGKSSVAERVRLVRKGMNLNIVEIAALTGYSQAYYSTLEAENAAEEVVLSEAFISRFCEKTGVNKEWLIHGTGEMGKLKPAIDYFEIACRVLILRKEIHLTQVEFSKRTGISQSAISRIEIFASRKDSVPIVITKRQLHGICDGCNIGYDWLVWGNENAKENPCNDEMIHFLQNNPELRRIIAEKMNCNPVATEGYKLE